MQPPQQSTLNSNGRDDLARASTQHCNQIDHADQCEKADRSPCAEGLQPLGGVPAFARATPTGCDEQPDDPVAQREKCAAVAPEGPSLARVEPSQAVDRRQMISIEAMLESQQEH